MNMQDSTNGQSMVWRSALSDVAVRQIDEVPPPVDETLDDRDIFAVTSLPRRQLLPAVTIGRRSGRRQPLPTTLAWSAFLARR
jgi:hypothetical protein